MTNIWCPYTDSDYPPGDPRLSPEHIVALSSGGHNRFVVPVDRDRNNKLGARLDGALANHPLVQIARRSFGLPGHKGKIPRVVLPASTSSGVRGQVDFTPDEPSFQTFRSKNAYGLNAAQACSSDQQYESLFPFELNLFASYGCKVALAASTFFFGDIFRQFGFHNDLRRLMDSTTAYADTRFYLANKTASDRFWALTWPDSLRFREMLSPALELVSAQPDRHVIFTVPSSVTEHLLCISMFSGLFRWYFNVAADATQFPLTGLHDLGTIVELNLASHTFSHLSMRDYLERLLIQRGAA